MGTAQPVGCARSPPVPGGTPRGKPTSSADISTNISTDTHEERPFGGHSDDSASADGPAAWSSPWPRTPAGALSTVQAPIKAPGVLLCPYHSARGPAELDEDVPHHIPCPAALGARPEQLPDELQNCPPHLPGESVVMTLLFKTQRVCLGAAFVVHGEMMRAWQKLLVLVSGLGFSTRLDGHLSHRAQRSSCSTLPALPGEEPSPTTWAKRQRFPRHPSSAPRERVSLPPLVAPSLPKPAHLGPGVVAH